MKYLTIGILRISLGWIFLWAFIDKLFGLGFATEKDGAWITGGSPTYGFLTYGTKGPFADFFQNLAGSNFIDWIFMIGLLGIGLALIFGIGIYLSTISGTLMMILMYIAGFIPPEHNPVIDDHIIYAITLILLLQLDAGKYLGLGKAWSQTKIVKKIPLLK